MASDIVLPGTLLFGRTVTGENVPVKVDADGLLAGGGNPFNQDLDTTDSPTFATLTTNNMVGNHSSSAKNATGTATLLAARTGDRVVIITIRVTETFADGTGSQPTKKVGQTAATNKFFDTTDFTGATAGTTFTRGGVLTSGTALLLTQVAAVGDGTGAFTISVLALPSV